MSETQQKIVYHSLVSQPCPMAMDLEIAQRLEFDGIELSAAKMQDFLAAGHSEAELKHRLRNIEIPGIGFLLDIERHGPDEGALFSDAENLFHLANLAGAKGVQIITGPVSVQTVRDHRAGRQLSSYSGVLTYQQDEQLAITVRNLTALADMAAQHNLVLYLEALGWLPLNTLADQVELIDRTGRDNIKLVVDFWHCYVSGDTPDTVSRLDASLIYGVHVCDSLKFEGGIPDEAVLRDVPTGSGVLDLRQWVDAVKSTGFVGWWSPELFCRKQHQENSFIVGERMKTLLTQLVHR